MRILISSILIVFCSFQLVAQKVILTDTGTIIRPLRKELFDFQFIQNREDAKNLTYVGTIESSGEGDNSRLRVLYYSILNQVDVLGGNCFLLKSYFRDDESKKATLILELYHGNREFLDKNASKGESKSVYFFAASSTIVDTLYIDKTKVPFSVAEPYIHTFSPDEKLKVQIWRSGFPVMDALHFKEQELKRDRFFLIRSGNTKSGNWFLPLIIGPVGALIYEGFTNTKHKYFEEVDQGLARLIMNLWK